MIKLTAESGTTSQSLTSRGAEAFLDTVRKTHSGLDLLSVPE